MCNSTLKPLTTKIQCYTVLIYSTCNQIKTYSCSSSYSRYYELLYLLVCVLVVFSGCALTVVLQKITITNTFYDLILPWNLWGFESKFVHKLHSVSVQYNLKIYTALKQNLLLFMQRMSHEIIRMQFFSRTLKIVRTFLDRGSVTKQTYLPS